MRAGEAGGAFPLLPQRPHPAGSRGGRRHTVHLPGLPKAGGDGTDQPRASHDPSTLCSPALSPHSATCSGNEIVDGWKQAAGLSFGRLLVLSAAFSDRWFIEALRENPIPFLLALNLDM